MIKTYLTACKVAILSGWTDDIPKDCATGNCFQILFYGLKSSIITLFVLLARFVLAVLFPLSAFLVIRVDKANEEQEKIAAAKAELDL